MTKRPDFAGLLARITRALDDAEVPFMLIGGQAVLLHGEPRLTQDIDVTLGLGPARLDRALDVCRDARLEPLPDDPRAFVERTFVLPAGDADTGIRVDFIFSTTPYEADAIRRAERREVAGAAVPFATAEDLIIHKLFAGRARDFEDATGVVRRKGETLDWDYMRRWCEAFASVEGREGLPARLASLRGETETSRD